MQLESEQPISCFCRSTLSTAEKSCWVRSWAPWLRSSAPSASVTERLTCSEIPSPAESGSRASFGAAESETAITTGKTVESTPRF